MLNEIIIESRFFFVQRRLVAKNAQSTPRAAVCTWIQSTRLIDQIKICALWHSIMKVLCDTNFTEALTLPDCWNAVECNYIAINQHLAPLSVSILWWTVTSNQNQSLLVYFWDGPGKKMSLKINYEWMLMIVHLW